MRDHELERRLRLLARLWMLPTERLAEAEELFERLEDGGEVMRSGKKRESGDESPHSERKRKSGDESPHSKVWPHAPVHRLGEGGTYMVTGATLYKRRLFHDGERLDLLEAALLRLMKEAGWQVEAWAAFSNHYHFVAYPAPEAGDLREVIHDLHGETARELNRLDGVAGRRVWHNYWDTKVTFEKSYLARLNYVHQNAVKHGLVAIANQYAWCSAGWFERTATRAQVATVYSFKIDKVNVCDDYDP